MRFGEFRLASLLPSCALVLANHWAMCSLVVCPETKDQR
jgi:hypothetical protein